MQTSSPASMVKLRSPIASTSPAGRLVDLAQVLAPRSMVLRSGTLDLPQAVVPAQDAALDEPEDHREQHADQAEQQDAAPHLGDEEVALEVDDPCSPGPTTRRTSREITIRMSAIDSAWRTPAMICGLAAGSTRYRSRASR